MTRGLLLLPPLPHPRACGAHPAPPRAQLPRYLRFTQSAERSSSRNNHLPPETPRKINDRHHYSASPPNPFPRSQLRAPGSRPRVRSAAAGVGVRARGRVGAEPRLQDGLDPRGEGPGARPAPPRARADDATAGARRGTPGLRRGRARRCSPGPSAGKGRTRRRAARRPDRGRAGLGGTGRPGVAGGRLAERRGRRPGDPLIPRRRAPPRPPPRPCRARPGAHP